MEEDDGTVLVLPCSMKMNSTEVDSFVKGLGTAPILVSIKINCLNENQFKSCIGLSWEDYMALRRKLARKLKIDEWIYPHFPDNQIVGLDEVLLSALGFMSGYVTYMDLSILLGILASKFHKSLVMGLRLLKWA